ncbi:hypothetical protein TNCV_347171 [Trichonephila clavipes]|nr:hypothetical protein TNCV_347171 [Trichonephila clavipes]
MFSMSERSGERVEQGNSRTPSVSGRDGHHAVLRYLLNDVTEASKKGPQPPALRSKKCNTGCLGYQRSEQEVFISYIQWLSIPFPACLYEI